MKRRCKECSERSALQDSSERGAALIEAAATLLTLMILLFAIFEAGRMINIQHALTNAAREGARFSVLPLQSSGGVPTDTLPGTSAVEARVQDYLNANGMNGAAATIDVDQACCDITPAGCQTCGGTSQKYSLVTVRIHYNVVSLSMFSFDAGVDLRGKAAMRNETNLK